MEETNVRDSGPENTQGTPKRRGRPPKPKDELKRHNVTIAMASPIRDKIGAAAEANGRSISSEIDFRLGMSLALEAEAGGIPTRRLMDFTRLAALALEEKNGAEWTQDGNVAAQLVGAIMIYIRRNSPDHPEAGTEIALERRLKATDLEAIREWQDGERALDLELREKLIGYISNLEDWHDLDMDRRSRRILGADSTRALMDLFVIPSAKRNDNAR